MVNKNVTQDLIATLDKFKPNHKIQQLGLNILQHSSKYKPNHSKLLQDGVIQKLLDQSLQDED